MGGIRSLLSRRLLRLALFDHIHQPLGQFRVVLVEVVAAGQFDGFAYGGFVGAATFVDFFFTDYRETQNL